MSITTALEARRDALRDREAGFTLIELLIVVLIIGILAAIAIPVYLGVQNSAKDSGVKSDLVNAKTALTAVSSDNSGAVVASVATPGTSAATATLTGVTGAKTLSTYGWSISANTTAVTFTAGATGSANAGKWCVLATSSTGNKFYVTSGSAVAGGTTSTVCPTTY